MKACQNDKNMVGVCKKGFRVEGLMTKYISVFIVQHCVLGVHTCPHICTRMYGRVNCTGAVRTGSKLAKLMSYVLFISDVCFKRID